MGKEATKGNYMVVQKGRHGAKGKDMPKGRAGMEMSMFLVL